MRTYAITAPYEPRFSVHISAQHQAKPQLNDPHPRPDSKRVLSQQTGAPVGAPWFVKIRRWSPVVLTSGAAGSLWVFVVVVPEKTLVL